MGVQKYPHKGGRRTALQNTCFQLGIWAKSEAEYEIRKYRKVGVVEVRIEGRIGGEKKGTLVVEYSHWGLTQMQDSVLCGVYKYELLLVFLCVYV